MFPSLSPMTRIHTPRQQLPYAWFDPIKEEDLPDYVTIGKRDFYRSECAFVHDLRCCKSPMLYYVFAFMCSQEQCKTQTRTSNWWSTSRQKASEKQETRGENLLTSRVLPVVEVMIPNRYDFVCTQT